MTAYKALIFDLGKVVFDLSFDRVFQSWSDASGKHFEGIKSKFVFDMLLDQFEQNAITAKDFRTTVSNRLGLQLSDEDFDQGWCNLYLDIYEGIDDLLAELKANYKLVALTNTNVIHNDTLRAKYANTLQHFEHIFSSHEMGTRKPDKESYETVLTYLQCQPEETIFLDDNPDNIEGARQLGIAAILVTSPEQMKEELKQYGIW